MRFSTIAVALASAAVVSAADFNVTVGANGQVCYCWNVVWVDATYSVQQLAFSPTSVMAAVGDTVHFELYVSAAFFIGLSNCSQLIQPCKESRSFHYCLFFQYSIFTTLVLSLDCHAINIR
jgi:hypothetical protein